LIDVLKTSGGLVLSNLERFRVAEVQAVIGY